MAEFSFVITTYSYQIARSQPSESGFEPRHWDSEGRELGPTGHRLHRISFLVARTYSEEVYAIRATDSTSR